MFLSIFPLHKFLFLSYITIIRSDKLIPPAIENRQRREIRKILRKICILYATRIARRSTGQNPRYQKKPSILDGKM